MPDNTTIQGIVTEIDGPHQMRAPKDSRKILGITIGALLLMPILLFIYLMKFSFRMAFRILGYNLGRPNKSLIDEIFIFHTASSLFKERKNIPFYNHVVKTKDRLVCARQEGEFSSGQIFLGNQLRLSGKMQNGTLIIEYGFNETLRADLVTLTKSKSGIENNRRIDDIVTSKLDTPNNDDKVVTATRIMDELDKIKKAYHDIDNNPLLIGGTNSYIHPDKYFEMAERNNLELYKSFNIADDSIIEEVKYFVKRDRMVLIVGWTDKEQTDMYLEPLA